MRRIMALLAALCLAAMAGPAAAYDAGMGDASNSLPEFFSGQGGKPYDQGPQRRRVVDQDEWRRQWSDPRTVGPDDRSKAPNRPTGTDQWNVPKNFSD
ncbi:hypothetical protein Deba_2263 [Desulfarculus baarsii DSM 2075]|uniref:Uncharacterized protein n=1 Tax=Desulfarculus baarsii (strain ATCC 33931 / DSM 2075 / LMG 7858 / VKM B-1802 / 2st14) TaxID=644282 RepID=E1QJ83_DESB2|nr:hypothetical protein [Desulfarculus baarsii]ADK85626.1 hypothetical protein Deba_2263 [Desulfarculus baarsii DSM 2075]